MFNLQENIRLQLEKYANQPFNTKTQAVVDYLATLDFSHPQVRSQAENYISQVLNEEMLKNLPVSNVQVKTIHCLVTHIVMADLDVQNTRLLYKAYKPKNSAPAQYTESDNTVTFYDDLVCKDVLLNPFNDGKYNGLYRTYEFAIQAMVSAHEVKHADQSKFLQGVALGTTKLTPELYHMSVQTCARRILENEYVSSYNNNFDISKYPDFYAYTRRLYNENHDNFTKEIDSDVYGIQKALDIMKVVSPATFELMMDKEKSPYTTKQKLKESEAVNLGKIKWNHDTNVNGGLVQADHKATFILTNTLINFDEQTRQKYFNQFPALKLTFNQDGTKKSLQQVELERDVQITKLMENNTDANSALARELSNLYSTAISCDAVYSFETILRDIVSLNGVDERFTTKNRFDPTKFVAELNKMGLKAQEIATYVETLGYTDLHKIYEDYKKQAFELSTKTEDGDKFYKYKRECFRIIDVCFIGNKNYRAEMQQIKAQKDAIKLAENQETNKQIDILKTAFLGFTPHATKLEFNANGELEQVNNGLEKLLVYKSYMKYDKEYRALVNAGADVSGVLPPAEVYKAFHNFYKDVQYYPHEEKLFNDMLRTGELGLLASCCTMELDNLQQTTSVPQTSVEENNVNQNNIAEDIDAEEDANKL